MGAFLGIAALVQDSMALWTPDFPEANVSVKNTFIHVDQKHPSDNAMLMKERVPKRSSKSGRGRKWISSSDLSHCRQIDSLEYLMSFIRRMSSESSVSIETPSTDPPSDNAHETEESEEEVVEEKKPAWSLGSEGHDDGSCRPCAWYWRTAGCIKDSNCDYCHLCDEAAMKRRKRQRVNALRKAERLERRARLKESMEAEAASTVGTVKFHNFSESEAEEDESKH